MRWRLIGGAGRWLSAAGPGYPRHGGKVEITAVGGVAGEQEQRLPLQQAAEKDR